MDGLIRMSFRRRLSERLARFRWAADNRLCFLPARTLLEVGVVRAVGMIENVGKRHDENDVACLILDLDGMIPRILASSVEHAPHSLRFTQCFVASSLDTGEAETKIINAPTVAVSANMKEEARHDVFEGYREGRLGNSTCQREVQYENALTGRKTRTPT